MIEQHLESAVIGYTWLWVFPHGRFFSPNPGFPPDGGAQYRTERPMARALRRPPFPRCFRRSGCHS